MNDRSRFSQSAILNGHTACGPTKKTVVRKNKPKNKTKKKKKERKKKREVFLAHRAQLAVQYIGPCLKV